MLKNVKDTIQSVQILSPDSILFHVSTFSAKYGIERTINRTHNFLASETPLNSTAVAKFVNLVRIYKAV